MEKALSKILSTVAVCGLATSAWSLTIVPTFDSSITSDPNSAAMIAGINAAIQDFQTNYTDSLTVRIQFVNDTSISLGQSSTWSSDYTYAGYVAAIRSTATSVNDANALGTLPNSATDPVIGNTNIRLTLPLARLTGLDTGYGPDGFDATIRLNMPLMNLTRPPTNSGNYDLIAVAEHEIDEVLGTSSSLPSVSILRPVDLFRYDTNLNRTFTTSGDNAYLSVDGVNLWARYNMNSGGDYADWWSFTGYWAPNGATPHAQVQDAFGSAGTVQDLGTNEFTTLDIIGYTLAVVTPPPTLAIVVSGPGQVALSWATNVTGYALQESANLSLGSWVPSATGSTNPAIVMASGTQKYYELKKSPAPSIALENPLVVQRSTNPSLKLDTIIFRPRSGPR